MRRLACAVALTGALSAGLLAGCAEEPTAAPGPDGAETSQSPSPTGDPTETGSAEPTAEPTETATEQPTKAPTKAPTEAVDLLDWKPIPGSVDREVTVSGKWRLTRAGDGSSAQLSGPAGATYTPPAGFTYSDVLIDGQFAVVVAEHEQATRPNVAEIVDLSTGGVRRLDGRSDPPTDVGGSWALGSGLLAHPTRRGRDYCLAVVDLLADRGSVGPCVPPRTGLTNVTVTPAGLSAMTFDSGRPSCRTLSRVEGRRFAPLRGVTECSGWDVVTTETAAVWSEIPEEKRIESAELYTDNGGGRTDLGPGTSGTLTWCGDAAYFVRDPQRESDPARLIRVTDGAAEIVYESPDRGRAFLSTPRCGGTDLTISAFTAAGDEQVTARVG